MMILTPTMLVTRIKLQLHNLCKKIKFELEINDAYRWFERQTAEQSVNLYLCLEKWLKNIIL